LGGGLLTLALFLAASGAAAERARGVVFEDRDGDGRRGPGEPGVADVAVSNGIEVVTTDAEGRYRLPVEDGTILFVTKPSGYAVPLSENNLPRFYYIHAPEGTPREIGLRYPGLDPTGPLPETVDFPLTRRAERDRFKVVWFADPQPQTAAEVDYVRDDVVSELVGVDAAFGITAGDIMYDDLSLFPRQNRILAQIGIPWYNVPGNHEINLLSPGSVHSRETFKRYFGPPYYSFDYGRVHFVAIDDVHYLGKNAGRDEPHPRGVGEYEGRIEGDQLTWLANDLRQVDPDKLVILYMHIPLRSYEFPEHPGRNVLEREPLFRLIEQREHVFAVAGHMHVSEHRYFGPDEGYRGTRPLHQHSLSAVSGSWWSGPFDEHGIPITEQRDGAPNGYYVMEIDETEVSMRFKAAGEPADHQLRIVLDASFYQYAEAARRDYRMGQLSRGPITLDQVPSTDVVVNLFDGGPRSTVELRIGDRPPVRMQRVRRNDPFAEELFQRHRESMKPFLRIMPSSHLWVTDLPGDLSAGVHTLSVRATDDYGREHTGHQLIEIVGP
jgi:hypothetical protein